ncbi:MULTISPECIES: hypothetical protein [Nostoc]|uniref:Uncharacterized protein n=1 Tax=Nostoc paludosum FACHB-159 TaxID=2692908 RepID=A0ABR8KCX5_9NOSO|nr:MULTISPECIES: hypothetical protein [Nostoc]MBD2680915.1 hypothetical protein [Nostoc sp. FACHB-857]MBD2737391.1 hypothetical protein [Nostoc paludosum FACHB-159]
MQVRLAAQVASKVEGVRLSLNYSKLTDTVNLLLDAIKHQWHLKLSCLPQTGTINPKVRLDERHQAWVSQYAIERGISVTSATNLLISEYLAGNTMNVLPQPQKIETENLALTPQISPQEQTTEKLKGQLLVRSLKL